MKWNRRSTTTISLPNANSKKISNVRRRHQSTISPMEPVHRPEPTTIQILLVEPVTYHCLAERGEAEHRRGRFAKVELAGRRERHSSPAGESTQIVHEDR
jgi:hypothetical protein